MVVTTTVIVVILVIVVVVTITVAVVMVVVPVAVVVPVVVTIIVAVVTVVSGLALTAVPPVSVLVIPAAVVAAVVTGRVVVPGVPSLVLSIASRGDDRATGRPWRAGQPLPGHLDDSGHSRDASAVAELGRWSASREAWLLWARRRRRRLDRGGLRCRWPGRGDLVGGDRTRRTCNHCSDRAQDCRDAHGHSRARRVLCPCRANVKKGSRKLLTSS